MSRGKSPALTAEMLEAKMAELKLETQNDAVLQKNLQAAADNASGQASRGSSMGSKKSKKGKKDKKEKKKASSEAGPVLRHFPVPFLLSREIFRLLRSCHKKKSGGGVFRVPCQNARNPWLPFSAPEVF